MSVFDQRRLPAKLFQIDVDRIRDGWYTDAYFLNQIRILQTLALEEYRFGGESLLGELTAQIDTGNLEVEMQVFTRRNGGSLIAGVDEALAILRSCTGYFNENGEFVNTYNALGVQAVQDGVYIPYEGDSESVTPVLKVRGRYRDFAHLETVILGVLAEPTRIATNVLQVLEAARGKQVLYFPARFMHYKLQALGGYAFSLAVAAYNKAHNSKTQAIVSTDAQGEFWGGKGAGTISHASIACFMGDTAETMLQFARILPPGTPRIALVDFRNDCLGETELVMKAMFERYRQLIEAGETEEALKYKLYAVRADTGKKMRDKSLPPLGDPKLDYGVNPRLVYALRARIDEMYTQWDLSPDWVDRARIWCQEVKISVTGGFDAEKIRQFEDLRVPVDIYGVGSSLLTNCAHCGTNNDFTADVVRVRVGQEWYPLAKVGRRAAENPLLESVGNGLD